MLEQIGDRVWLGLIHYANCWEDADILCQAIKPAPGRRVLSIASGGDNSFALAAAGAEVVAADLSAAQLACVELKRAALRRLEHHAVLEFLGIHPSENRAAAYARLKADLPGYARDFWEAHPELVAAGIIHAGKFERYFRIFRTRVLPLIHTRKRVDLMFAEKDDSARRDFYDSTWNSLRWRLLFRIFFSRFVMGRLGREPEFFRYVQGSVAQRIMARAEYAMAVLETHRNPYLQYTLRGNFSPALPQYLRPEFFEAVRGGLDRLTLFHGPVEEAARKYGGAGFDGFNLSDIFEYLSPEACRELYAELLGTARSGARLVYWNMLAPRSCPGELLSRVRPLAELAARLHARDMAFFYTTLVVEEAL